MRIRELNWLDPAAVAMRQAQVDEIAANRGAAEPGEEIPAAQMVVVLAAEENGTLVSIGALRDLGGGVGEIKRMYTVPRYRHRGLGYAILAGLEEHARTRRMSRLVLSTGVGLRDAMRLYERSGYTEIPAFAPFVGRTDVACLGKYLTYS